MSQLPSNKFTRDEFEQAFRDVEASYLSKLKERGEPPYLFDHRKLVIREFKNKCPAAPPEIVNALEQDFARRHR